MRTKTAIIAGKLISQGIKVLNYGGGSAAPGLYALKIDPKFIENLAKYAPKTIMITGTNGKTTTSKMLAQMALNQGYKVLHNPTGSNLERGVASALIKNIQPQDLFSSKMLKQDLAIWEVDEAAFNVLAPKLKPDIVIFLNVFRDQLDRYGEVDTITAKWGATIAKLPQKTTFVLNGNDPNIMGLKSALKGKYLTFGIKDRVITAERSLKPFKKETLSVQAENIQVKNLESSSFKVISNGQTQSFKLPVPGEYHIYDFLAAYTAASLLKITPENINQAVQEYAPAFGRMEKLKIEEKDAYIFLIKNPYGSTQVFQTIQPSIRAQDVLFCALNDNLADGTDVSWIWDAEFEQLLPPSKAKKAALLKTLEVVVSGTRADEMALRLKYAGFNPKKIIIEDNLDQALKIATEKKKGQLFILPTYTALLQLQRLLAQKGLKQEYWK